MQVVRAETVLTVHGGVGEIAEIALHLALDSSEAQVLLHLEDIDDAQIEWLEAKMGITGLHYNMSILFQIIEEVK